MKYNDIITKAKITKVAPARERGLKCLRCLMKLNLICRSREGAWIEICIHLTAHWRERVAPARERGLKYYQQLLPGHTDSRSREGAWIEIRSAQTTNVPERSLPRGSVD